MVHVKVLRTWYMLKSYVHGTC